MVDGGGKRSAWNRVDFNCLLSSNEVLGYLYDEDIIGKDDYLGEFRIDIKEKIESYKAKIVKEGKTAGRIMLNGEF